MAARPAAKPRFAQALIFGILEPKVVPNSSVVAPAVTIIPLSYQSQYREAYVQEFIYLRIFTHEQVLDHTRLKYRGKSRRKNLKIKSNTAL